MKKKTRIKKKKKRIDLFLICENCKKSSEQKIRQNYRTVRLKSPQQKALYLKKFCPFCNKSQFHREQIISKRRN